MSPDPNPQSLATRMAQQFGVSTFRARAKAGIANASTQQAVDLIRKVKVAKRQTAIAALEDFDGLRQHAIARKDHALANLPGLLEQFERKFRAGGGHVHWAETPEQACAAVIDICRGENATAIVKSKSMITEEIHLNDALESHGFAPLETDLGEYIIQLRGEKPSHIIAPSLHVRKHEVAETFKQHHTGYDPARPLDTYESLLMESRQTLRDGFLRADVGITGANLLIAETGHAAIVTNEGNADLCMTLPRCHIIVTSIDKVIESRQDAATILRLLARSATGQAISAYTTFVSAPGDGAATDALPRNVHLVLLDGGRSEIYNSQFREVLRCIRCGACMNHCPVYHSIGGHAYGWVYPGPIGAVLSPLLHGLETLYDLPQATSFCGRCVDVCPMGIPLTALMREHREAAFRRGLVRGKKVTRFWGWLARHPRIFHALNRVGVGACSTPGVAWLARRVAWRLARPWRTTRTLNLPAEPTFMAQYRKQNHG